MTIVKNEIDRLNNTFEGIKVQKLIPCNCSECIVSEKPHFFKHKSLLNRVEKGKPTIECDKSFEDVNVFALMDRVFNKEPKIVDLESKEKKNIFISYSHDDIEYRVELEKRLKKLLRDNKLNGIWTDNQINGGANWNAEIENNMRSADIIILLISDNFWASDYIDAKEIPIALEKDKNNSAIVISIIIKKNSYFGDSKLSTLQAIPSQKGKLLPIKNWGIINDAWVEVVKQIKRLI